MEELMQNESNIKDYILADEKLLWRGEPTKKIRLLPAEKFNVAFGIAWTAFSVFWMSLAYSIVNQTEQGFSFIKIFPAFGLPFFIIGIYFMLIMPIRIIISRRRIEYALTDKRALILYVGKREKLSAYKYTEIQNLNFGCDELGNGYVTFISAGNKSLSTGTRVKAHAKKVCGFYHVSEVKKLYKILCAQIGETAE
ncbi:MAG: hypothetical protein J6A54_02005 [Clostridia bacterium]|nr:hypothetical protein [Clostridia bacterium]